MVLKVPAHGRDAQVLFKHFKYKGVVGWEKLMTVATDGTMNLLGDDGNWRQISAEGELVYCSKASMEDQEDEDEDYEDDDEYDDEDEYDDDD